MKILSINLVVLIVLFSMAFPKNKDVVDFQVFIMGQSKEYDTEIYGTFNAEDGQFGGIEMRFYKDPGTFAWHAVNDVAALAKSYTGVEPKNSQGNLAAILMLFVSPELTHSGDIHLNGSSRLFDNTSKSDAPAFNIKEQHFDCTIPDGGDTVLSFYLVSQGRDVKIKLTAALRNTRPRTIKLEDIQFNTLFSLVNDDAERPEIRDEPCLLQFTNAAHKDIRRCKYQKTFDLQQNKKLLYMVTVGLDKAVIHDDGRIDLNLVIERWFFVNPKKYFDEQTSKDTAGATYSKGKNEIKTSISIDGKKRRVEAEIDNGTVVRFKLDNINFLDVDIVRNWKEIVAILTQVENGRYYYHPPKVESFIDSTAGIETGMFESPTNLTGSMVTSTTYSRAFTLKPLQDVEISILLGDKSLLPFKAHEIIKLQWPDGSR